MKTFIIILLMVFLCGPTVKSTDFALYAESKPAQVVKVKERPVIEIKARSEEVLSYMAATANRRLSSKKIRKIARTVEKYADVRGLDPYLVMAVIITESNARPKVRSRKGARGLMQVMPHMVKSLGFKANLYSIDDNIRIGTYILADNIRRWGQKEGVQRYFWGNGRPDGRYLAKVRNVMERYVY